MNRVIACAASEERENVEVYLNVHFAGKAYQLRTAIVCNCNLGEEEG